MAAFKGSLLVFQLVQVRKGAAATLLFRRGTLFILTPPHTMHFVEVSYIPSAAIFSGSLTDGGQCFCPAILGQAKFAIQLEHDLMLKPLPTLPTVCQTAQEYVR